MRRIFAAVLVASLFLASPAFALDLSRVRCEDKQMIEIIEKGLKNSRLEGGGFTASYVTFGHISKSTTRASSRNKLICDITITASGQAGTMKIKYTLTQFSSGKLSAVFSDY